MFLVILHDQRTVKPGHPVCPPTQTVTSCRQPDYVESAENSPTSPANTLDLAGHIRELEAMHKVLEGDIVAITWPTVIFSHTDELKITEIANTETDLPKNLQDNGTTLPVNTQPPPLYSPP